MSEPLVIPEDLKKVCPLCKGKKEITYDYYEGRILGSCYFCSGTGVVRALTLEQMASRIVRLEAENKRLSADASWAATHRSELADLRGAFAKAEAEVATLKDEIEAVALALLGPGATYQPAQLALEVTALKAQAEWTRIDAEHLPKVGDEIGGWDTDAEGGLYWYLRAVDDDEQVGNDLIAIPDMTAENWAEQTITHYRPKKCPPYPLIGKAVRNEPGREGL